MTPDLRHKISTLPDDPGIYMMKNSEGEIIYVGKAKSIKKRVKSYFVAKDTKDLKTKVLVENISDLELILTTTESEAILLERNLIRQHQPRYNILLKDGKEYPFIRVDFHEPWPRIEKVRKRKDDKAYYIGPFSNAGQLNTSLNIMQKIFPVIHCSRSEMKTVKRVCNYYHMGMCLGPCHKEVDREEYLNTINDALAFLNGKNAEVRKQLKERMKAASAKRQFEQAAKIRDQISALESISKSQHAVVSHVHDADIFGVALDQGWVAFHVTNVRESRIIGGESFVTSAPIQTPAEAIGEFVPQFYQNRNLPSELIFPDFPIDEQSLLEALIQPHQNAQLQSRSALPSIIIPKKGQKKSLVENAIKNAIFSLESERGKVDRLRSLVDSTKEQLNLPISPRHVECIDISNLQGTHNVASIVCFIDAKPARHLYRHYNITSLAEGEQNDFAAINEVVRRRLERGAREDDLPDLLVIDGGKGQLSAALAAAKEFKQNKLLIISLAKSRGFKEKGPSSKDPSRSYERVFIPGNPQATLLKPGSEAFRLLTSLRDEAHRFAIESHRKKRGKASQKSELDDIPGVGPTRKRKLLRIFGTVDAIRHSHAEEISAKTGFSLVLGEEIAKYLNQKKESLYSDHESRVD